MSSGNEYFKTPAHITARMIAAIANRLYWVTKEGAWRDETVQWVIYERPGDGKKPPPPYVIDDLVKNLEDPSRPDLP